MSDNRKTAKKLLLVNWSCFQNETIRLESSTLFTGVNGTGKTTILDAMAYLLTANTQFNKAADDKERTVTAYIHGDRKTNGSDRYLRKGEVTSYIAMEFYSPIDKSYFVVAVCIESRSEQDRAESKWLCIPNAKLEEINFCVINDGKQITTSRNNLSFKGQRFKSSDFLGRDKAIPQITRALGIRGDYKKYREKLVKMMAFDPERNVDKFLQDSVLSNNNEVNSLKQLREQKELYEKAKQMFDDMKQRKVLLEKIEEKTCDYEKALRSKNIREMMFEYQYLNANKIKIEEINIKIKNLEIEKKDLEKKNQQSQKELEIARKQLSDAENKNHDITETLEKLENIRKSHSEKVESLESEIAKLKQLQIALKQLSEILKSYFEIDKNQLTILENFAETDFSATEKRSAFIDFSQKVLAQKELFIKEQGREEDRLKELKNSLTEIESNIKKLESNVVIFPREAEIAKQTIKSEFEKRGIKSDVRFFAELVESLTDESWRKAIETFLGRKRYYIIVDDEYCHVALKILQEKKLHSTNIVLSDKIPESDISENSASEILVIKNNAARKYANYLLNGIHLCKDLEELHENPKGGLMQDGMLSKSYSASLMKLETKFCLGNNVVKLQLEQAKKEKSETEKNINVSDEKIRNYEQLKKIIENIKWDSENYNFDSPQEILAEQKQYREVSHQIEELRESPEMISAMKEIEIAEKNYKLAKDNANSFVSKISENANETKHAAEDIDKLNSDIKNRQNNYAQLLNNNKELESEMLSEYKKISAQQKNPIVVTQNRIAQVNTYLKNATTTLENIQLEYNKISEIDTEHRGIEFIPFYREQLRSVANVQVDEAKEKLEIQSQKLRDVFLHDFVAELKENIDTAKNEIDKINAELKKIPFGRDVYQFKMIKKQDREIFFEICENLEMYSETPDLFTQRTASNEKVNADVQEFLSKILDSEDETDYSDYRNYFNYDMTIKSKVGDEETEMDLSKKQGSASGGEKQTPYFIVLAASLMQFYPRDICCARIAFIDEAFSALSKERIEQMVKFLEDNNFQVFYAAPPEKISSIGQHIDNTVSLYTQGKFTKPVEGLVKAK